MNLGLPLDRITKEELSSIEYVVSDVDDTITSNGRLLPIALDAMYLLKEKRKTIILLTGGSAGWADSYIRQWPVDFVVAESGAVLLKRASDGDVEYITNGAIDKSVQEKRGKLFSLTKECVFSSDQYARIYDIAYDAKKNSESELIRISKLASNLGANMARSSIHLNVWFGSYDKWSGLCSFVKDMDGIVEERFFNHFVYLGDALNDQILFKNAPISIGMKSVLDSKSSFEFLPTYIANGNGGFGFEEVCKKL